LCTGCACQLIIKENDDDDDDDDDTVFNIFEHVHLLPNARHAATVHLSDYGLRLPCYLTSPGLI